jgi:hypothetical protein
VTKVVIPVAEDQRRSALTITRNLAIVVVAVAASSWLVATGIQHDPSGVCRDARHDVTIAEARYHKVTGAYTDSAGLQYSGYLTHSPWPFAGIRLQGPVGAATDYTLLPSRFC